MIVVLLSDTDHHHRTFFGMLYYCLCQGSTVAFLSQSKVIYEKSRFDAVDVAQQSEVEITHGPPRPDPFAVGQNGTKRLGVLFLPHKMAEHGEMNAWVSKVTGTQGNCCLALFVPFLPASFYPAISSRPTSSCFSFPSSVLLI